MIPGLEYAPKVGDESIYERRLHGNERMTAAIAEHADGFGHIFDGTHVTFKTFIYRKDLLVAMKDAWIRTRFDAPWVATRTSPLQGPGEEPNSWKLSYETSPTGAEAARRWAEEIVIWREESLSLEDWEEKLKDEFWKPSAGRFGMECHLAKAPGDGYFIMFSIAHWLADGRGILPSFDVFFKHLKAEIKGDYDSVDDLPWGEEIPRLSASPVKALNVSTPNNTITGPPPPPANAPVPFMRPVVEETDWACRPSRKANISLSGEDTTALHRLCRSHKTNITAVLNSIHIIADVKTALRVSAESVNFEQVLRAFDDSDVYPVYTNVADRRNLLLSHVPAVVAPAGFGSVVNDNFATFHDMKHIRNCINVSPMTRAIHSSLRKGNFWNGLAAETQQFMRTNAQSTPDLYSLHESAVDSAVASFDASMASIPGIMCSSVGNMTALKLFDAFRPATALPDPKSPFCIRDMSFAVRASGVTAVVAMMWEYDGRLEIHLQSSPRYHSDEAWDIFVEEVKQAIAELLKENPKSVGRGMNDSKVQARL
ncbi:hypothetical protein CPC08DRAFT_818850 [Agrocybe pediades]|nr:hypothetical protein CPC08DRAFT_818850 [Agrocybe pediades]